MKHNASMLNSDCPFFSNFPDGKENRFYNDFIRRERHFVAGIFSDFVMEIFDLIARIAVTLRISTGNSKNMVSTTRLSSRDVMA